MAQGAPPQPGDGNTIPQAARRMMRPMAEAGYDSPEKTRAKATLEGLAGKGRAPGMRLCDPPLVSGPSRPHMDNIAPLRHEHGCD